MRISDWSSDVCSSDLWKIGCIIIARPTRSKMLHVQIAGRVIRANSGFPDGLVLDHSDNMIKLGLPTDILPTPLCTAKKGDRKAKERQDPLPKECRSEEHTSELQSLMRNSYAVFCLKKKQNKINIETKDKQQHTTHKYKKTTYPHTKKQHKH